MLEEVLQVLLQSSSGSLSGTVQQALSVLGILELVRVRNFGRHRTCLIESVIGLAVTRAIRLPFRYRIPGPNKARA